MSHHEFPCHFRHAIDAFGALAVQYCGVVQETLWHATGQNVTERHERHRHDGTFGTQERVGVPERERREGHHIIASPLQNRDVRSLAEHGDQHKATFPLQP